MNGPAWLASPFRIFYLLGVGFGLLWLGTTAAALALGLPLPAPQRHAHEMIFGFALAIVVGTALTALPGWAGIADIGRVPLALLAAAWLAGRLAVAAAVPAGAAAALAPADPARPGLAVAVAVADLALPLLAIATVLPPLVRLRQRRWLLLPLLLAGFAAANGSWHWAVARGDAAGGAQALRLALWPLVLMFALAGGLLTPVFTANVLRDAGRAPPPPTRPALEVAAMAALLALAVCDLRGASAPVTAGAALAALGLQGWRVARWRGWRAARDPLVLAMHLGFAWLLAALALKAASAAGAPLPEPSWVHAFTVGALGTMMLGLMTRVALRHTGRPAVAPRGLRAWLVVLSVAALLRVAAPWLGAWALGLAAAGWVLAFAAWLLRHGPELLAPSLPRDGAPPR
jgi:uncharacterized protein involved in response to NO